MGLEPTRISPADFKSAAYDLFRHMPNSLECNLHYSFIDITIHVSYILCVSVEGFEPSISSFRGRQLNQICPHTDIAFGSTGH